MAEANMLEVMATATLLMAVLAWTTALAVLPHGMLAAVI